MVTKLFNQKQNIMESISYEIINKTLENKYKKQFDKVFKKLGYTITSFEMEVLYNVLENRPIIGENSNKWATYFKGILK